MLKSGKLERDEHLLHKYIPVECIRVKAMSPGFRVKDGQSIDNVFKKLPQNQEPVYIYTQVPHLQRFF